MVWCTEASLPLVCVCVLVLRTLDLSLNALEGSLPLAPPLAPGIASYINVGCPSCSCMAASFSSCCRCQPARKLCAFCFS